MSRLQELIDELCPDGVEYKALGEVGEFYGGLTGKSKKDFGEGAKFVTYNNVYGNPAINLDEYGLVNVGPNERQNTVELGDVIFTISSENREEAGLTSVMTVDPGEPWYLNSFCTGWRMHDKSLLLPDFLKHVLRGPEVRQAISRTANGVTRFNISKPKLAKVRIPVPPIEVQREVVRILDEYTAAHDELVRQLEEEMRLHEQQLANVRNELLTCGEEVGIRWATLGEVAWVGSSKRVFTKEFKQDGVPFFRGTEIGMLAEKRHVDPSLFISPEHYESLCAQTGSPCRGDLLFPSICPDGRVWLVDRDDPFYIKDGRVLWIHPTDSEIDSGYLCYAFSHYLRNSYNKLASGTSFAELKIFAVKNCKLPFPPLEKQQQIVALMDNATDSFGEVIREIRHDIEMQLEQLTLVRNQLLSFPEKVA